MAPAAQSAAPRPRRGRAGAGVAGRLFPKREHHPGVAVLLQSGPGAARPGRICGHPGGSRRAREARLLRGIDEQGDRRLGLERGRPPRAAVMAIPGSLLRWGLRRSGLLPCRRSYARGALSERLRGARTEKCRLDGALCVQPEIGWRREGFAFSFQKRDKRRRAEIGLEAVPSLCTFRK